MTPEEEREEEKLTGMLAEDSKEDFESTMELRWRFVIPFGAVLLGAAVFGLMKN